jgi:hypothetical protein
VGSLAESLNDFMARAPGLPEQLILLALLGAPLILVHELGHALTAKYFGARTIELRAGGAGPGRTTRLGGVQTQLAPFARPWRLDGFVMFDPTGISPLGLALIALAGPAASIAVGFVTAQLMTPQDSFLNNVLWVATFSSLGAGLLSLVPMRLVDSVAKGRPGFETDGLVALRACGYSPRPRGGRSPSHLGAVGSWALIALGIGLLLAFALAPDAENVTAGSIVCAAITGAGVWGLARSRG